MLTIDEIMMKTECSQELAEKMYGDLLKLPERLRMFVYSHLDAINACNADDIEVRRHYDYSEVGCNIIVKRVNKMFPTYSDGTAFYDHWRYSFNCLVDYVGITVY